MFRTKTSLVPTKKRSASWLWRQEVVFFTSTLFYCRSTVKSYFFVLCVYFSWNWVVWSCWMFFDCVARATKFKVWRPNILTSVLNFDFLGNTFSSAGNWTHEKMSHDHDVLLVQIIKERVSVSSIAACKNLYISNFEKENSRWFSYELRRPRCSTWGNMSTILPASSLFI